MKLVKYLTPQGDVSVGQLNDDEIRRIDLERSEFGSLEDVLNADHPVSAAQQNLTDHVVNLADVRIVAPIDNQEVWAAGVTYKRSQTARMEESETSASCYDQVYDADRPELFFKATPNRVSGPGEPLRIRFDATWNVPEPEITCVINQRKQLIGFTIGNDMSSRDIEGENPLYLPQAKLYNQSAGLGPCVTLVEGMPPREEISIHLQISRDGKVVFRGESGVARMARSFEHLIEYLGREQDFPHGAFLMTGTGIVPDNDFTLMSGDLVEINIDGIGTLTNPIVQG